MAEIISLVPILTSNASSPSNGTPIASVNEVGGWNAFDGLSSTWWLASATTTNAWVGFRFNKKAKVSKYTIMSTDNSTNNSRLPKNFRFEASDDGVNWITLDTRTETASWRINEVRQYTVPTPNFYSQYRVFIIDSFGKNALMIGELGLYGSLSLNKFLISSGDDELYSSVGRGEHNPLLAMTSNASPLPQTASASSVIGANDAWKAFDGISASYWSSDTSDNKDLIIGLGVKKIIKKYQILGTDNGSPSGLKQNPKDWTFEGSNTGSFTGEQVILDTRSGIDTWTASEKKEFAIPFNNREFSYYRLHVTSTNGNAYLRIYELELLATDAQGVKVLKSLDELSFVGHGMDRATEFDLTQELSFKAFIEQSPTTLGSGKVFRKTIDTSKIPIKSVSIT